MKRLIYLIIMLLSSFSATAMMHKKIDINKAIDHAVMTYGIRSEPELKTYFKRAHISYPPQNIALLAFKKEQRIDLWAKDQYSSWRYVHTYPLTAYSGKLGPKLKERDRQIPEGVYHLVTFNPFSAMHLSMMIDYPNQFDRRQAQLEGRKNLGGNIFLHGKSMSVGCLAVGDRAIDQLFLLARRVGLGNIKVIISPNDLRVAKPATHLFSQPHWLPKLYRQLSGELSRYKSEKNAWRHSEQA